ncbi:MAG: LuxR C-terminal-related transcriptional regulator [Anaerolineales bacterium]
MTAVHQSNQIILLSGAAGFGKTTLLTEFSNQVDIPVAWVSLDEGDNDPIQFWTYVVTAIERADSHIGQSVRSLFQTPQIISEENIPIFLVNDLDQLEKDLILILDDYHLIQNPAIHKSVSFLLDHLPAKLHPIVSTRIDPPWLLARLRARNQLVEIRAADLRFNLQETTLFLNDVMTLDLSRDDIELLGARTEGWIASLQLAAISLKGKANVSSFIKSFAGSHTYIADYLVEEVLSQLSTPVRTFLLQTSILDRLNAGLCNAVTQHQDSDSILRELYHSNLFLLPLDDELQWFRYHHLFADLLRARFHDNTISDAPAILHERAATWYEQAGMVQESIQHFVLAKDYSNAVRLLETIVMELVMKAHFKTLEEWLRSMPTHYTSESPRVNMAFAWLHLTRRNLDKLTPYLETLERFFANTDHDLVEPALLGEWFALQSMLLSYQGRTMESRDLSEKALQILPTTETQVRSMVYMALAEAYQQVFDSQRAGATYEIMIQSARESGDLTSEIMGTSLLGRMWLQQGRLHSTFQLVSQALERIEQTRSFSPFCATLYGELAQVYYQWHQLEEARRYFLLSVEWSKLGGFNDAEIYHSVFLSRLFQMEGDPQSSLREIEKALDLKRSAAPTLVGEEVIAQQVAVFIAVGRGQETERILSPFGFLFHDEFSYPPFSSPSGITHPTGLLYISALRILLNKMTQHLEHQSLRSGIELADLLVTRALENKILPIALQTLLLRSQLYALDGEYPSSLQDIMTAVGLAETEGFISIFVEEGERIAHTLTTLCDDQLLTTTQIAYTRNILLAFPQHETTIEPDTRCTTKVAKDIEPLIESLTQREMDVLKLIASGCSNRDIGDKLVITLSAVKKHTGNIFHKLNVNSRTQAIARARELGLLALD